MALNLLDPGRVHDMSHEYAGGFLPGRLGRATAALTALIDSGSYAGVVTRVWRRGVLVQQDCIGAADRASGRPMTPDAIFRIASMTKPVVSVAVLMALEEGRLRLIDPITRWLPEFADVRVLRTPESALDDTVALERPLTILDLLLHRSGLSYVFNASPALSAGIAQAQGEGAFPLYPPDQFVARLAGLPLIHQPGTGWHYGYSTDMLGVILARMDGCSLGEILERRIFSPLGMVDTAFHVPAAKLDRLTVGYGRDDAGTLVVEDPGGAGSRFARPPAFECGGGGLLSTADDYLRFARMLLGKGEVDGVRLLGRKTVEAMTRNWLTPAQRRAHFPSADFLAPHGFGLGVSTIGKQGIDNCLASPGKFGWPGAYTTRWFVDPAEDLAAVMMTQLWFDMRREISTLFDSLIYQAIA